MSRLFLSSPVIRTRRYGSGRSYFAPFEAVVTRGEMSPGSGCPYICGSFPYRPPAERRESVCRGAGRGRLGMGVFGTCGVVGHGGSSAKPLLSGSNVLIAVGGSGEGMGRSAVRSKAESRSRSLSQPRARGARPEDFAGRVLLAVVQLAVSMSAVSFCFLSSTYEARNEKQSDRNKELCPKY